MSKEGDLNTDNQSHVSGHFIDGDDDAHAISQEINYDDSGFDDHT
jgi:hypothetical protein